jgi:arylsulfatase
MHTTLLASLILSGLAAMPAPARTRALAGSRPNIIVILTDDQGYGDIVSPTCAPTRAALFTGRHEFRNGVTHTILERDRLTPDAVTLADALAGAGYTTGIFGKWHLGDEPAYRPERRGFDEVFIHGAGGIGQTYPGSNGDAPGNTYVDPATYHNGAFEKTNERAPLPRYNPHKELFWKQYGVEPTEEDLKKMTPGARPN